MQAEKVLREYGEKPTPLIIGRSERIRTSDPCVPNAVLYQAEPRSE